MSINANEVTAIGAVGWLGVTLVVMGFIMTRSSSNFSIKRFFMYLAAL